MPATVKRDSALRDEAPPAIIISAIAVVVLLLGVAGFYFYNGGWQTQHQREEYAKHNLVPIMAAKHGDKTMLEAENKMRREHGQQELQMPQERAESAQSSRDKLMALQKQLEGHQGTQTNQ